MPTVTTFLWFDDNAQDAARFYTSVIPNSKILEVTHYSNSYPGPKDKPFSVRFSLDGQEYIGLNGGPHFKLTPAVSLFVLCDTQDEIDHLWNTFLENGGTESQCGWLTDGFGLSWQIVPRILDGLLSDPDREKANRAMQAMLKMVKLDITALKRAHAGA